MEPYVGNGISGPGCMLERPKAWHTRLCIRGSDNCHDVTMGYQQETANSASSSRDPQRLYAGRPNVLAEGEEIVQTTSHDSVVVRET